MARPKFTTAFSNDKSLEIVAQMTLRGYSQREIGEKLGITQPAVSGKVKVVRERWKQSMLASRDDYVAQKIAQYEDIRREAWEAYDRSRKDHEREQQEFATQTDEGTLEATEFRIKRIVTRDGRLPMNQYLQTIMQTLAAERELLGLDAPVQMEVKAQVVNWDAFAIAEVQAVQVIDSQVTEGLPVVETAPGQSLVVIDPTPSTNGTSNGKHVNGQAGDATSSEG